jgi:hypothetical protein
MSLIFVSKLNTCGLNGRVSTSRTDNATSDAHSCLSNCESHVSEVALFVMPGAYFFTAEPGIFNRVVG